MNEGETAAFLEGVIYELTGGDINKAMRVLLVTVCTIAARGGKKPRDLFSEFLVGCPLVAQWDADVDKVRGP